MRKFLILIFAIIIVGVIVSVGLKIFDMFSSDVKMMTNNSEKDYILKEDYSGIVTKKYIDSLKHNYRTIIVESNNKKTKLLFDFVLNGVYEFIEEGDSLSKNKGSLDLNLKRKDLDTIIHMEIYNRETNKKSNNHKELNTIENNKSECDKHYNYLDSIPISKELNSKVSFELIKCISKDINTSKYIKAELISNHKYNGFYVVLYRLICNAGAVCRHYFISTMSNNYNIIDVELIAVDAAEGENNKFVDNFKFMRGKLSFKLTTEYYDEEIQDYIINTEKKYFSIDKLGNVDENK